jgi:sugar O-acyltransferase (sialic acid O-acetyltransferase NeuD family)
MKTPLIGMGAGGHARSVIELLRLQGKWDFVGLLDENPMLAGVSVMGVPVLGGDDLLAHLWSKGQRFVFNGLGSVGSTRLRRMVYERALSLGYEFVSAVHPSATVSPSVSLGQGTMIMAASVIGVDARIGNNVVVNTAAVIEHDCRIGDHVHVASGAVLGGGVEVAAGAHIGIGAVIRQGIRVGCDAVVGAGACVVKDVEDSAVVVGVPAKPLRP